MTHRRAAGALLLGVTFFARPAWSEDSSAERRASAAHELGRAHTTAQVMSGFLSLPKAELCPTASSKCITGEASVLLSIVNMYRIGSFGIGAGIAWATTLRGDTAKCNGETCPAELERDHTRRYFLVEAQGRYYAHEDPLWEAWLGYTLGTVIVNDAWTVKADREIYNDAAFVGPKAATIGTEGLSTGIAVGADYAFSGNWSTGVEGRYGMWFLPEQAEQSPLGDHASLSGRVDSFELMVNLAYRIAL